MFFLILKYEICEKRYFRCLSNYIFKVIMTNNTSFGNSCWVLEKNEDFFLLNIASFKCFCNSFLTLCKFFHLSPNNCIAIIQNTLFKRLCRVVQLNDWFLTKILFTFLPQFNTLRDVTIGWIDHLWNLLWTFEVPSGIRVRSLVQSMAARPTTSILVISKFNKRLVYWTLALITEPPFVHLMGRNAWRTLHYAHVGQEIITTLNSGRGEVHT